MVRPRSSLIITTFLMAIGSVLSDAKSVRPRSHFGTKGLQDNCFEAFEKCSKSEKCRAALRGLDSRCKVISGHCSAAMVDLPRCGQIMDHIFSFGFPQERCSCPEESKGCSNVLDKVYTNPCFASIRHLRKNGLFPKEINAYDRVSRIKLLTTTRSPLTTILPNGKYPQVADEESKLSLFEEVFGDKKSAKKAFSRIPETIPFVEDNKVIRDSEGNSKALARNNPRKEVTTDPRLKAEQTAQLEKAYGENVAERFKSPDRRRSRDNFHMLKAPEVLSRETDGPVDGLTKEANTDFRSIAIILAILLGTLIVAATGFLLWVRLKAPYFYKNAKFVKDQREDNVVHSTAPLSPVSCNHDAV